MYAGGGYFGVQLLRLHMPPDSPKPDGGDEPAGDTWTGLRYAVEPPRANLIADIVGHPEGAPSIAELAYTNPSLDEAAIRSHLDGLQEAGMVKRLEDTGAERRQDCPDAFYALTQAAREAFDEHGLFPEGAWRRQYASVEKPVGIQRLETIPRPD